LTRLASAVLEDGTGGVNAYCVCYEAELI